MTPEETLKQELVVANNRIEQLEKERNKYINVIMQLKELAFQNKPIDGWRLAHFTLKDRL